MKTLVEPQVAFTDFEYGRRAALRGRYRILCCPESPAAYREWLAGYDSVRREDRGKWPLVGPVPAALQYLANVPALARAGKDTAITDPLPTARCQQ